MTTEISHISVQYSKTIGRGEQFGPGFNYPVYVARGKEGVMYVLCRGSEFRPEGVRVTVCTTDEEYISTFARGVNYQGPHEFNQDDGSLVWPTSIALDSQENLFISDEWLNRISSFSKDGDFLGKWEEKTGSGDATFYETKLATGRYYMARQLPATALHLTRIQSGADTVMALEAANF